MKIIYSTNDREIQVSDIDYDYLMQWRWTVDITNNYAIRTEYFDGKSYTIRMHLVVLDRQGIAHPDTGDHIDHNGSNNQRENLRPATYSQSAMHRKIQSSNTSGYKGVSWHPSTCKWRAQITIRKKRISLGLFDLAKEAAIAYDLAAIQYQKEFAVLNFPDNYVSFE